MIMKRQSQKGIGAYYTPDSVVASLVQWVVRHAQDRMLDPSCGDGRFIAGHRYSVGLEQNSEAARSCASAPCPCSAGPSLHYLRQWFDDDTAPLNHLHV